MNASIFFLIVALCICTLVIIQVRNLKMKEKYAALWLGVGARHYCAGDIPRTAGRHYRICGFSAAG